MVEARLADDGGRIGVLELGLRGRRPLGRVNARGLVEGVQAVVEVHGREPHAQLAIFAQGPAGGVTKNGRRHHRTATVTKLENRIRHRLFKVYPIVIGGKTQAENSLGHLAARSRVEQEEAIRVEEDRGREDVTVIESTRFSQSDDRTRGVFGPVLRLQPALRWRSALARRHLGGNEEPQPHDGHYDQELCCVPQLHRNAAEVARRSRCPEGPCSSGATGRSDVVGCGPDGVVDEGGWRGFLSLATAPS